MNRPIDLDEALRGREHQERAEREYDRQAHDEHWGEHRFDDIPPYGEPAGAAKAKPSGPRLIWFGDREPEPPPWLVQDILPQAQTAITAGVYSAGKTFVAGDLSVCVMLAVPFAGREIVRPGAVLWLAAEGQNEINGRVRAAAEARAPEGWDGRLPFAWQAFDVPKLTAPESEAELLSLVDEFKATLAERFPGVELVMIVVDTLGSAAAFADPNSGGEAQRVMDLLRRVNVATRALVMVVDHFGKMVETGVKGASEKAQMAEAVFAILCDKNMEGDITNRRMVLHKLRSGGSGGVTPFKLCVVPLGGFNGTTCVVEWSESLGDIATGKPKASKPAWSGNARVLKGAIERAMIETGKMMRPTMDSPEVKAVAVTRARAEFYATYSADTQEAKKKAFKRLVDAARASGLIATREIAGNDFVWFAKDDVPENQSDTRGTGTPPL